MADRGRKAFPVSSHLLEDKWHKHDLQLHKDRLNAMKKRIDNTEPASTSLHPSKDGRNVKRTQLAIERQEEIDLENEILLDKMVKIKTEDTKAMFRPFLGRSTFQLRNGYYYDTSTNRKCLDHYNVPASHVSIMHPDSRPMSADYRKQQQWVNTVHENSKLLKAIETTQPTYANTKLEQAHGRHCVHSARLSNFRGPEHARYMPKGHTPPLPPQRFSSPYLQGEFGPLDLGYPGSARRAVSARGSVMGSRRAGSAEPLRPTLSRSQSATSRPAEPPSRRLSSSQVGASAAGDDKDAKASAQDDDYAQDDFEAADEYDQDEFEATDEQPSGGKDDAAGDGVVPEDEEEVRSEVAEEETGASTSAPAAEGEESQHSGGKDGSEHSEHSDPYKDDEVEKEEMGKEEEEENAEKEEEGTREEEEPDEDAAAGSTSITNEGGRSLSMASMSEAVARPQSAAGERPSSALSGSRRSHSFAGSDAGGSGSFGGGGGSAAIGGGSGTPVGRPRTPLSGASTPRSVRSARPSQVVTDATPMVASSSAAQSYSPQSSVSRAAFNGAPVQSSGGGSIVEEDDGASQSIAFETSRLQVTSRRSESVNSFSMNSHSGRKVGGGSRLTEGEEEGEVDGDEDGDKEEAGASAYQSSDLSGYAELPEEHSTSKVGTED